MVPIRFSQHEHRILTGQKPYFKRVLPLFSKPYLVFKLIFPADSVFHGNEVNPPTPVSSI